MDSRTVVSHPCRFLDNHCSLCMDEQKKEWQGRRGTLASRHGFIQNQDRDWLLPGNLWFTGSVLVHRMARVLASHRQIFRSTSAERTSDGTDSMCYSRNAGGCLCKLVCHNGYKCCCYCLCRRRLWSK